MEPSTLYTMTNGPPFPKWSVKDRGIISNRPKNCPPGKGRLDQDSRIVTNSGMEAQLSDLGRATQSMFSCLPRGVTVSSGCLHLQGVRALLKP